MRSATYVSSAGSRLHNTTAIEDFTAKDDYAGVPNSIDLLACEPKGHSLGHTPAQIVDIELDAAGLRVSCCL